MTNYREILRLQSLGLNKSQIAAACIFRSVSAHKPFVLCMVSAETVHEKRSNCAWIPRG